jgi:hypothetical protein
MVQWLEASHLDQAQLPEAACRASLVAAVAWQTCGEDKTATKWFGRARDIARSIGDRATIMASIENRALMRLDGLWVLGHKSNISTNILIEVELELLSGLVYEIATGSNSFDLQGVVARIRVSVLKGDFRSALEIIDKNRESLEGTNFSIVRATTVLRIWLEIKLEIIYTVDSMSLAMLINKTETLDNDDAVVCWHLMSEIALKSQNIETAADFESRSEKAYRIYLLELSKLRETMKASICIA